MVNNRWAVLDCGKYPSADNCKIKLSAPEDQVEKLIDLAAYHASKSHGHENSQELKNELRKLVEYEENPS
ncbi:MAG: DUF1059 domain-containing protein [Alphaproteobacteria bacterium]|nr:DUF1059 domain-containing protein [Alphaproteobacteria bacterium]